MAYDINKSDGSLLVTVPDGSIEDTASSIKLIGKNYTGYGEFIAENLIHMLEHFASTSAPSSPQAGQLWFDKASNKLNVYDNNGNWKEIGQLVSTATEPNASTRLTGDLWWDTANEVLYIWNGTKHVPVGIGSGSTSVRIVNILDTGGTNHVCIAQIHDNRFVSVTSGDSFTPASTELQPDNTLIVSEFPTIGKGINMTNRQDFKFRGTATVAEYADLAERYHAGKVIEPGTLVGIHSSNEYEIEVVSSVASPWVFGVISTAPGVELNANAGTDATHPYVALAGRVPCKVVGPIRKGQRLVSSGIPGVAKGCAIGEAPWEAIFGRALENYDSTEVGIIEVVVGVK